MALFKCIACGTAVSSYSNACISCGNEKIYLSVFLERNLFAFVVFFSLMMISEPGFSGESVSLPNTHNRPSLQETEKSDNKKPQKDSPPSNEANVENRLEAAFTKFNGLCFGKSQNDCFSVAQKSMQSGDDNSAMLLALYLCHLGEMGSALDITDPRNPCEWYFMFSKETIELKRTLMKNECERGNKQGCLASVATNSDTKLNPKIAEKREYKVTKNLCEAGFILACVRAGQIAIVYKTPNEQKNARKFLTKACNAGDQTSCKLLTLFK